MDINSMAILILLGDFFLMVFLHFPATYTVVLSSAFCLLLQGHNLTTICQQMIKSISSFSLTVAPFFIIMGCLIDFGGISEKLTALANACVDWTWSGMAMVSIVASYFFGGISGSASADTTSLGSILVSMTVNQGYDDDFSIAVTIISLYEGLLVLPSHNMVIYAIIAGGISVESLSPVGYTPEALLAVTLMIGSHIISTKHNYPRGEKLSIVNLVKQLSVSFWILVAVLIIVFGVVNGVFTTTESAAIAAIYSLIVNVFIYRGLDWEGAWRVLGDSVDTLSIVMIPIATSNIFGFYLTQLHVSALAANIITGMANNPILLILLPDLALLALECTMDMVPIILVVTPILSPIATSIDLDPIQLGIMVMFNCGTGLLAPSVGTALFIGFAVSKVPMEWVVKVTLPLYVRMIITLLLITFIPAVSMWPSFVLAH